MILTVPVKGVFWTNCYFYADENTGHCFIIDPGAQGQKLIDTAWSNGWVINKILITHGHFDHTGGISELRKKISPPVYAHELGRLYLTDTLKNLSRLCGQNVIVQDVNYLHDGDIITLSSNHSLRVIHTPGHTEDSITLYDAGKGVAFVGDTIFKGSPGSDKYPGGNTSDLQNSIRKILALPERTVLYSGHSEPTTVKDEHRLASSIT
ncbi:MAG: MBL fold metallo-hydrolase [Synergistaceae bacterium]|nr:MBL fold metallo-hydrolase [Synergistaceae bacterium]